MTINSFLHNIQNNIYNVVVYTTWLLYILVILGLSANAPQYLNELQYYLKMYISLHVLLKIHCCI